jgi:hypothetical protein
LDYVLATEDVHVLGHSQWIWYPEELGVPYKFVHFYRRPSKKIVSGVSYHASGVEGWTKTPQSYSRICEVVERNASATAAHAVVRREELFDICKHTHLCEPCCRREHEAAEIPTASFKPEVSIDPSYPLSSSSSSSSSSRVSISHPSTQRPREYRMRSTREYEFLCKYLRDVKTTLQTQLMNAPDDMRLGAEAAVDYFEVLRMAKIYNHTYYDPDSININLDDLTANFGDVVRRILDHLDLGLSKERIDSLANDLSFFDLQNSPMYRWSMGTVYNHLDTHS